LPTGAQSSITSRRTSRGRRYSRWTWTARPKSTSKPPAGCCGARPQRSSDIATSTARSSRSKTCATCRGSTTPNRAA